MIVEPLPGTGVGPVGLLQITPEVGRGLSKVPEVIALAGVRPEEVRVAAEADDEREDEEAREDDDRESADGFGRDSRGASADGHGGPGPEGSEGGERGAGHCDRGERDYEPDGSDARERPHEVGGGQP